MLLSLLYLPGGSWADRPGRLHCTGILLILRTWEAEGRPSLAVAKRFLVEIDLCADWLVGNLSLFLREVPGRHLDVMERSAGKEFQNLSCSPGCVVMSPVTLCAPTPARPPFLPCKIRLIPTRPHHTTVGRLSGRTYKKSAECYKH